MATQSTIWSCARPPPMCTEYSIIYLSQLGIVHILHNHFIENIGLTSLKSEVYIFAVGDLYFCMAVGHKIHEVTDNYVK